MCCCAVQLYDLQDDSFTWGSWMLDGNKSRKAALRSAALFCIAAFERIKLTRAVVDVHTANRYTPVFHRLDGRYPDE